MITWKQVKLIGGILAGLAAAAVQFNSYIHGQIQDAVAAGAASKDDISRLEGKIDKITDYLLSHPHR